jgi:hypothetical protein
MPPLQLAFALIATIAPEGGHTAFRQPQLAVDGSFVAVAFGSGDAVYFTRSEDRGATFSPAVRVNREDGRIALGRHRGPRIAISGGSIVISAIFRQTGDLISWRSEDKGKTWSAGVRVNDAASAAREGLHAMAAGAGLVYAAWLDLRAKGTRLYGSRSRDGGDLAIVDGKVWSAWRRENKVILAAPDGKENEPGEGKDPSIAAVSGRVAVVWTGSGGKLWISDRVKPAAALDEAGGFVSLSGCNPFYAARESGHGFKVTRLE